MIGLELAIDWAQFILPGVDMCLGFKAEGLHGKELAIGAGPGGLRPGDVGFHRGELGLAWGSSSRGFREE